MTIEQRAMLGDKEAQRQITERGTLLPCMVCGGRASAELRLKKQFMRKTQRMFFVRCEKCGTATQENMSCEVVRYAWNIRFPILTIEQIDALEAMEHENNG